MIIKFYSLLFILFFAVNLSSQTITALQRTKHTKLNKFEREFLADVVDLYNLKYQASLKLKFKFLPDYKSIFDSLKAPSDITMAISRITWTEDREKMYDFSIPYMPITTIVIGKTGIQYDLKNKHYRVNYKRNTVHKKTAIDFSRKNKFTINEYEENISAISLIDSENIVISDYTDTWFEDRFKIIQILKESVESNYCIMYPENSSLKIKLDGIIKYYTKSSKFYSLLKQILGNDISSYFKNLKFHQNRL